MNFAIAVIGASLGGLDSLRAVLAALPRDYALPVAVVQHREADSGGTLQLLLGEACALPVREALDKEPIEPGAVYLAPGGYHLLIEDDHFALSTEEPVLHARPSIDVLFETAAARFGPRVAGVVLSGTGSDGAQGLAAIERAGGLALVESPASARAGAMPRAAIAAAGPAVYSLGRDDIGATLAGLDRAGRQGEHL